MAIHSSFRSSGHLSELSTPAATEGRVPPAHSCLLSRPRAAGSLRSFFFNRGEGGDSTAFILDS